VLSEKPDGIAVVGRRPPAFCRADVLRDIDTRLSPGDAGHRRVLAVLSYLGAGPPGSGDARPG
jgi:hypothetical protein